MKNKTGVISHIELYVNDLEKSLSFWAWFLESLGYVKYQKWDKGISFIKDDTYIVFVETEEKYKEFFYHRCHHGLNHLAFYADKELIINTQKKLSEEGYTILYHDKYPNEDYFALFFEDPDRMKVELVEYRAN